MKLNRTNKKITSLLFSILMITLVFAGFVMFVVVTGEKPGGGIISGRVICYAGNPVADASIRVGKQMYIGAEGWATTDADGNYTITSLATGTYDMRVHPPFEVNLIPVFITDIVVIAGEAIIVDVTLEKGGIISGRVTCYAGNPVASALIDVRDPVIGNLRGSAWTDTDGNYTIIGLTTGTYEMEVRPLLRINLTPAFITVVVTAGETTIVNVTMEEGGLISGRIICHAGNPVVNAEITAWEETGFWGWGAQTDADGNYTITGLARGTYEMKIHPSQGVNLLPAFITVVVTAGETTIVNVTMEVLPVEPPVEPPEPIPRIPGFGIIVAILSILGAILILLKRKIRHNTNRLI